MKKCRRGIACFLVMVCAAFGIQTAAPAFESDNAHAKSLASYAVGVMYDFYGQTDEAIEQFQRASEFQDNYAIRLRLGADYARLGKLSEAISDLQKALEFDPKNVQARYLLALIYSTQKDYNRAAQEYESILKSFAQAEPENVEIYGYLAQLYYSQKQYQKAIQQFEAVLLLDPQNTEVMFLLGALHLESGQEDKAIELFKRTIALDPEHDSCLNSLGYVYAERGKNLDEAQHLIERALAIDENNAAYLDSLGWVYYKKGEYQTALTYLYKASAMLKDPVIYEHIGDTYLKMHDAEKAKQYWEMSLHLVPDQEQVLQKLDRLNLNIQQEMPSE